MPEKLKRDLSFFDMTSIVVGAIVGSDIYIASAITAGIIGPFSIFVWVAAGIAATVLALIFAYSSFYVPKVGGSFAYVSIAFDDFYGFIAGWSMWIAEILSLPVFAITFANYLQYFIPLNFYELLVIKGLFVAGLTLVNIIGVKAAGRVNDVLTIAKLSPLLLLVVVGFASFIVNPNLLSNYTPLAPFGLGSFGTAFVLIFWAYVGFELGTLPSSEVIDPKNTVPKAIIVGMGIVALFYISTNFVIFGIASSSALAKTAVPLVLVGTLVFGAIGGALMSAGALISVSGSDESGTLGTSRLSYAMAVDGLFPKIFTKIHTKYKTPYMALIIQGVIALALSAFSGLSNLISFSVFNLAFSFLLVCFAFIILRKKKDAQLRGQGVLPWLGIAICLYLLYSTSLSDKVVGSIVILLGIPIYIYFSPRYKLKDMKRFFLSEDVIIGKALEKKEVFLAGFMKLLHEGYSKLRSKNA
jgi:amino acid transporter